MSRDSQSDMKTLIRRDSSAAFDESVAFALTFVEGPDAGLAFEIDDARPRVFVGTSPTCDVRLTDRLVSRRHLSLDVRAEGVQLVDLGSTNGTWVNGVRVRDAMLAGAELVRLGEGAFRVGPRRTTPTARGRLDGFGRVVGASAAMQRIYPLCARLASTDVPCLVEGETGTGKEVLAEALHEASPRARGPFVVFDCTTVPPNLIESVLFGHERGSFTGASAQRRGVFELAHGGTLFLDEIGDLDVLLQPKLLRAVQRGEVQRVGSERWSKVDVRVISATRRDLERQIQEGRFRDDLFYRIAVARVELPPLREREGDVERLARHFWAKLGGRPEELPYDLLSQRASYEWPGNVRELENTIARRFALGDLALEGATPSVPPPASVAPTGPPPASVAAPLVPRVSTASVAPPSAGAAPSVAPPSFAAPAEPDYMESVLAGELPFPRARDMVLAEFERRYVTRVLHRHGGNVAEAAAASGIARRYFQLIRARTRG